MTLRALIDFTLSNARRFYSSMGNPLDEKGLTTSKTVSPLTGVMKRMIIMMMIMLTMDMMMMRRRGQFLMNIRAANNFPAGAGQIVRSNQFLLRHIPFLDGQTSVIIILNSNFFPYQRKRPDKLSGHLRI